VIAKTYQNHPLLHLCSPQPSSHHCIY